MSELGERIRSIRESEKLTIDDLSKKTNITVPQLEALEQSNIVPSLAILNRICHALNISQNILLDGAEDTNITITRKSERKKGVTFSIGASSQTNKPQTMRFYPLAAQKTNRMMEPYLIHLEQGDSAFKKISSHEGEEFMYITKGEVAFYYGDQIYTLREGDSMYYDSIVPHSFESNASASEIVVVIYLPA